MKPRMNPDELERFIHQTLRALPDRKAPGTLEARVLAEVERRAAIPWWHKSWSYWPQPAVASPVSPVRPPERVARPADLPPAARRRVAEVNPRHEWRARRSG